MLNKCQVRLNVCPLNARLGLESGIGGSELPILRVDRGDILAGFALKY